jgi:hypothetical protein
MVKIKKNDDKIRLFLFLQASNLELHHLFQIQHQPKSQHGYLQDSTRDVREIEGLKLTLNVSDVHFTFLSVNLTASLNGRSETAVSNFDINVEIVLVAMTMRRKIKV